MEILESTIDILNDKLRGDDLWCLTICSTGNFLVVQWLGLNAFSIPGGLGSFIGRSQQKFRSERGQKNRRDRFGDPRAADRRLGHFPSVTAENDLTFTKKVI